MPDSAEMVNYRQGHHYTGSFWEMLVNITPEAAALTCNQRLQAWKELESKIRIGDMRRKWASSWVLKCVQR